MSDKASICNTTAASLSSLNLQARLDQAEKQHESLERSISRLHSSFAFRIGRLVVAPAAFLRRKFGISKKPETSQLRRTYSNAGCTTEGAGGYLLSAGIHGHDSGSFLKIEFYDADDNRRYYYQYPLNSKAPVTPSVLVAPTIRNHGADINFKVVVYIGSEIAYLEAVHIKSNGDQTTSPSLDVCRVINSGEFVNLHERVSNTTKKALRIACILDEFTWTCLYPEADLVQLKPDDDWEAFDWASFDFLLVESAWRGEASLWRGALGNENPEVRRKLENLLASCKKSGLPSAFWNKEDPVHYEYFKSVAAKFDHIFTTDENVIEKYRNEFSNPNVYCLPFFIQPKIHNPIREAARLIDRICFAGTWYGEEHADRTKAMQGLLDAAIPLGLDIYDRMYLEPESIYKFPIRYYQHIKGKLSYGELCEAHKYYACFINVNTVTESPSMCARRVFEVLASSTPVVSNPSLSLAKYFKGGVLPASGQEQATAHFSRLLSDSTFRALQGHLGFRSVMGEHTARERLKFIKEKLSNTQRSSKSQESNVTIISIASCEQDVQSIVRSLKKFNDPAIKLLLGVTFTPDTQKAVYLRDNASIVPVTESGMTGYEILLDKVNNGFAVVISPTVEYGPNYVKDKLLCFVYLGEPIAYSHPRFLRFNNDIVCRDCVPEHEFTCGYDIDSLVIDLDNKQCRPEMQQREAGWLESMISLLSAEKRVYATDTFNFLKPFGDELGPSILRDRMAVYTEQDVFV